MKNKLNAILLVIAFPLLLAGINSKQIIPAMIGICLIIISAGEIILRSILSNKG